MKDFVPSSKFCSSTRWIFGVVIVILSVAQNVQPNSLIELEDLNKVGSSGNNSISKEDQIEGKPQEEPLPYQKFGFGITGNGTIEDREKLIQDLLKNYDARNYPSNVTVELGASLLSLDIDNLPRANTFKTEIVIRKFWIDPRLKWNSSSYGGHTVISLPSSQVWKPDIRLLNSAALPSVKECDESNVLINRDGQVLWVTQCQYFAFCSLNSTLDNYGPKRCSLVFGSWAFGGSNMDLQSYKNESGVDFTFFEDVSDVNVSGTKVERVEKYYGFYSETFPVKIKFHFFFQRQSNSNVHKRT